jgi:ribosomal protein S18 acetylase RimI-like enzyme
VQVRAYRDDEVPALRDMVFQLHETVRRFDPSLPPAPNIIDAYFDYLIGRCQETDGTFLVAESDGKLVGYLCLFAKVAPEADHEPVPHAFVADLYVSPTCQGQGLGEHLMRAAEAMAREKGAHHMELCVLPQNRGAIGFYERLGYSEQLKTLGRSLL